MIPGVDSWAVAVALSLDSLWSSWPWIPFGLALDDSRRGLCSRFGVDSPAGNRAAVAWSLSRLLVSWILFGVRGRVFLQL